MLQHRLGRCLGRRRRVPVGDVVVRPGQQRPAVVDAADPGPVTVEVVVLPAGADDDGGPVDAGAPAPLPVRAVPPPAGPKAAAAPAAPDPPPPPRGAPPPAAPADAGEDG